MYKIKRVKGQNSIYIFNLTIVLLFSINVPLKSQSDYPFDISFYNFIQYDKNKFFFPSDSTNFERFFSKMDSVILHGEGKITIVHIGGSHVQADVYPGRTREKLQTFYPGMNGGRGFVFPYKLAQTNSPPGYKFEFSGQWETTRNVEMNKSCNIGLSGITAITRNPDSKLKISLKNSPEISYSFDRVKIFHSMGTNSFLPVLDSVGIVRIEKNQELGFSVFFLDKTYEKLIFGLQRTDSAQHSFELYGFSLENDDPGVVYNSMGINGASFNSYLRCNLLEEHLKALNPDLVIISLGTNDAYTTKFKPEIYQAHYEQLINKIIRVVPNSAILNTVANDSYLFRRYPNKNTQLASEVIYRVAKKYNCGVWDFYEVMGGFNSSKLWLKENLMGKDLVHFNHEGYLLKGDLFFNAFIKSYDNHVSNHSK